METVTRQQPPSRASERSAFCSISSVGLADIYAYYHGTTDREPLITRRKICVTENQRNIEKL